MKRVTLVIGAGGTGSYLLPNLANLFHGDDKDNKLVVVDGDTVEHKNLLRQGFLGKDLNKYKSEVLAERYALAFPNLDIYYGKGYVNDVHTIRGIINSFDNIDEILLISCVDNNYARLRMLFAQHVLHQEHGCDVYFLDSGNEEWHGQMIPCKLERDGESLLELVNDEYRVRTQANNTPHLLESIFTGMDNWRERLTRGDHELSCDEVTASHPQNIGTNMMASSMLTRGVSDVLRGVTPKQVSFNSKMNTDVCVENHSGEVYLEFLEDVCTFVNTEDTDFIGNGLLPIFKANHSYAEELANARRVAEESQTSTPIHQFESVDDFVKDILGVIDGVNTDGDVDDFLAEDNQEPDWVEDLLGDMLSTFGI